MYHVEVGLMLCCYQMAVAKEFAIASFLAQCGDIESNPGPKAKKEAKPDPKKVMEDKVRVFFKNYHWEYHDSGSIPFCFHFRVLYGVFLETSFFVLIY